MRAKLNSIVKKQRANSMKEKKLIWLFLILNSIGLNLFSQRVPGPEEGIDFLVTTGGSAKLSMGDDDHCQVFFFSIPAEEKKPVYLRIFDPNIGGQHDEAIGEFNSTCKFSLYGGPGCHSTPEARMVNPIGNYRSGNLLAEKSFGPESKFDGIWYSFEGLNPHEGEKIEGLTGEAYAFKIICQGISGDDGNLYQYFLSSSPNENIEVPGGKAFTYEYTFRLKKGESNLYPFVDRKVLKIKFQNFDFDMDYKINLYSHKQAISINLDISGDMKWASHIFEVSEADKGKFLHLKFFNQGLHKNNNISMFMTNQYDEALPFFPAPLKNLLPNTSSQILPKRE